MYWHVYHPHRRYLFFVLPALPRGCRILVGSDSDSPASRSFWGWHPSSLLLFSCSSAVCWSDRETTIPWNDAIPRRVPKIPKSGRLFCRLDSDSFWYPLQLLGNGVFRVVRTPTSKMTPSHKKPERLHTGSHCKSQVNRWTLAVLPYLGAFLAVEEHCLRNQSATNCARQLRQSNTVTPAYNTTRIAPCFSQLVQWPIWITFYSARVSQSKGNCWAGHKTKCLVTNIAAGKVEKEIQESVYWGGLLLRGQRWWWTYQWLKGRCNISNLV